MADETTKLLLKKWNCEHLINHFARNEVDENILKTMTVDVLQELIPNVMDRVAFAEKRNRYFSSKGLSSAAPNENKKNDSKENVDSDEEPVQELQRQNCFKGKTDFYVNSCNIKNILNQDPDGENILKSYFNSNIPLNAAKRNKIVDIILRFLRQKCDRLYNENFRILAKKITNLFKNEKIEIYYIESIPKKKSDSGKSKPSKGKLPVRYRNNRQNQKKFYKEERSCEDESNTNNGIESNMNSNAYKEWLSTNSSPWETVVLYWNESRDIRSSDIKNTKNSSLGELIGHWPILKHPLAYELIELDFYAHNSSCKKIDFKSWNYFFEEISHIRPINTRDDNAVALYDCLQLEDINENSQVTLQLLLLPHLIPPQKKVAKTHKISISECKDSIIIHTTTAGNITKIREDRSKFLSKIKHPMQPFIIVVGENSTVVSESYICMGNILYQTPNVLKALLACYTIFHVLDTKYPPESHHLWCIIQEGLFDMKPEPDSAVAEVITDLLTHRRLRAPDQQADSGNTPSSSSTTDA